MALRRKPPEGNVRRVRHSGGNIPGIMTNKTNRKVQFESHKERKLLLRLDRDQSVLDYVSQPETFEFTDEQGRCQTYTPDYKVWRVGGQIEIHQVTCSDRKDNPSNRQQEEAVQRICQARGWLYIIHTENSLPQPTEAANLLALNRYRPNAYYNSSIADAVLHVLKFKQKLGLRHLGLQLERDLDITYPLVVNTLGYMIWHEMISTDLIHTLIFIDSAINYKALVWLP